MFRFQNAKMLNASVLVKHSGTFNWVCCLQIIETSHRGKVIARG